MIAWAGATWARAGDDARNGDKPAAQVTATVADLAWIAGDWQGEIFGGPIQEMWTAPQGGSMAGVSRMGASAKKATYESLLIEETDGVPTMYLRHFGPKLGAREGREAMAYPLVSLNAKTAVFKTQDAKLSFQEIVYAREGDVLTVKLIGTRGGRPMTITSVLKPAAPR